MTARRPLSTRRSGVLLAAGAAALGLLALPTTPAAAGPTRVAAASSNPSVDSGDGFRVVPDAATGDVRVTYRLDEPLPITDARPEFSLDGEPIGPALVSPDGRTLVLATDLATPPDPVDLDVSLSGRPLDEQAKPGPVGGAVPDPPAPGPVLDVDPAAPGAFDTENDDYELDALTIDTLPNVETVGHVEGPTDAGAVPVVLFLHGRHTICYKPDGRFGSARWPCPRDQLPIPSQLGYTYVQEILASQGYLTVSIAANGINGQDFDLEDGGAQARADLVEHHLDLLADGSLDEYLPAGTTADLDQVVLVGHSRGGEGVNRATETDAPGGAYEVVGQVLLAPTDFALQATPYVPSVTVLPYCDGDVSDLQGQLYTDVPRDLTDDDSALHSSVLVMGANHNFFNTEWTPGISKAPSFDDAGYRKGYCAAEPGAADPRLEARQQRDVGAVYIAGAVRLFTGESDLAPLFDGTGARAETTQGLDIRSNATGALRDVVRPGIGSSPSDGTAATALCEGTSDDCLGEVRYGSPHFPVAYYPNVPTRPVLRLDWTAEGQTAGLSLEDPINLEDDLFLDLRVLLPPLDQEAAFDVALTDDAGVTATITPADGGRVAALPRRQFGASAVAQTLRADLEGVTGVNLAAITSIELVTRTGSGTAWLIDAAGTAIGLPDPGSAHAPALDLDQAVSVDEGDGLGSVEIPYTLSAPAPAGARVRLTPVSFERGGPLGEAPVDIALPKGATEGTLALALQGDDGYNGRRRVLVVAFPIRGVVVADGESQVTVLDDDPTPVATLEADPSVVREGDPAVLRGSTDLAFASRTTVVGFLTRGPGPVLRVGDLGRAYLGRNDLYDRDPRDPAIGRDFPVMGTARAGATTFELRLPTRADRADERRERVTVRLRGLGGAEATVTVRD